MRMGRGKGRGICIDLGSGIGIPRVQRIPVIRQREREWVWDIPRHVQNGRSEATTGARAGGGGGRGANHWWSLHTTNQGVDSHESLAPRRGQPGVKSSNGEPLSSPESKRATTQHIHPRTTPTNTSDRSVCRFGDMCKSARCPWHHPTERGPLTATMGCRERHATRRRTPEAVSMPAEKERARNWEERKQQNNWAQGRPTHGSETSPNRTHNKTQGNHEVRALQQPPNAVHAERAISKHSPLALQGAHILHKGGGCAPRAGRCPPRGWQQGRDQPTAHGTVHVVRRCEILVRGGWRVGQEGVRGRGTRERQQTRGGATQTHRTREPHQEGQGRAQQTRRRGTARQERQSEQREQGTRMERMVERAHGRQRQ